MDQHNLSARKAGHKDLLTKKAWCWLLLTICFFVNTASAQPTCTWSFSTSPVSSTCASNGKINVTVTGAESLTGILYSIEATSQNNFSIAPNTSSSLENIPAGTHRVKVEAFCNGQYVSKTADVVVGGNYVPITGTITETRKTLDCGNYGQATVGIINGKKPYTVTIIAKPATYTGRQVFVWNDIASSHMLDSLAAGDYTITIQDACSANVSTQQLTIHQLAPLSGTSFGTGVLYGFPGDYCNSLIINRPYFFSNYPDVYKYQEADTLFQYSMSIDGGQRTPYRSMHGLYQQDTVLLPVGKTFSSLDNDAAVVWYIKPPCGQEINLTTTFFHNYLYLSYEDKCGTIKANITTYNSYPICFPAKANFTNTVTNIKYTKDITSYGSLGMDNLPYGTYNVTVTDAEGKIIYVNYWRALAPVENPYQLSLYPNNGSYGNDGAAYIFLYNQDYNLPYGTSVYLKSAQGILLDSVLINYSTNQVNFSITTDNQYIYPGDYTIKVQEPCRTFTIPFTIREEDVYRYTWNIDQQEQTCAGLKITPSGTSSYQNNTPPVYYKILSGPGVYNTSIVPAGSSLLLPNTGTYQIGIGSNPAYLYAYLPPSGNGVNVKTITYTYQPPVLDMDRSIGWVCPGQPSNSGTIRAFGKNGVHTATGNYTYKLAAAGNGATGPYLDVNTTGQFSTAKSNGKYVLNVNQNYDVRVVDDCGAAAVQSIKILDLATAQIAFSDKNAYCTGENIHLGIINLPSTAITFNWSGPNGFHSTEQNPVITNITSAAAGEYTVIVNSDMCGQPLTGKVNVTATSLPAIPQISGQTIMCPNTSTTFTATAANAASITWSMIKYSLEAATIDPVSGVLSRPAGGQSTFATVSATAQNSCGNTINSILVNFMPDLTANPPVIMGNELQCQGTGGDYFSTSPKDATRLTYTWGLSSPAAGDIVVPSNGDARLYWKSTFLGSINLMLTATSVCGTQTVSRQLTVLPQVYDIELMVSGPKFICSGHGTTTYVVTTKTPSLISSYKWSLSDDNAGTINPSTGVVTWNPAFNGNVDIQVRGTNGACWTYMYTFAVSVGNPDPTSIVNAIEGPSEVCAGYPVHYSLPIENSAIQFITVEPLWATDFIDQSSGTIVWSSNYSGNAQISMGVNVCNTYMNISKNVLVKGRPNIWWWDNVVCKPEYPNIGVASLLIDAPVSAYNIRTAYGSNADVQPVYWYGHEQTLAMIPVTPDIQANEFFITIDAVGCNDLNSTTILPIEILSAPSVAPVLTGTLTRCMGAGNSLYFASPASNENSYSTNWRLSDAAAGTIESWSGKVTWSATFIGKVIVYATISTNCGTSPEAGLEVTVTEPSLPIITGNTARCQGAGIDTFRTVQKIDNVYWTVDRAVAGTMDSQTGVMQWADGFSGTAVIYANAYGCGGRNYMDVVVTPRVSAPSVPAGPNERCASDTIAYYSTSANEATSYNWKISPSSAGIITGNATGNTVAVKWLDQSASPVTITVNANGCNSSSGQVSTTTTIRPVVQTLVFTSVFSDRCQGPGTNRYNATAAYAYGYTWTMSPSKAGSIMGSGNVATVKWNSNYNGPVTLAVAANGCGGSSQTIQKTIQVNPSIQVCYSIVTDTVVNPYTTGLLGNWRNNTSYVHYTQRSENDPLAATNIRKDGAYKDFSSFWQFSNSGLLPKHDTTRWVWNSAITLFNTKGSEIENKDPLGRYNAGLYGYDQRMPTAVVQNSRYREAAFDGFEDYFSSPIPCDTTCPVERSFGFSNYRTMLDTTQSHTGKYSMRLQPGQAVGLSAPVLNTDSDSYQLTTSLSSINCSTSQTTLNGIRTDKKALLPVFAPSAGSK